MEYIMFKLIAKLPYNCCVLITGIVSTVTIIVPDLPARLILSDASVEKMVNIPVLVMFL